MVTLLLSSFFLNLFGVFNLFGIKRDLVGYQIAFFIIGLLIFFIARQIGLPFFRRNAKFFYWLFAFLLIITFIVGIEVKGSKRWIDLYFFNFQPSEFFKVLFIVFLSDFFTRHHKNADEPLVFLKSIGYLFLPLIIIFKQPDFGNAMAFAFIYGVLLLFSRTPKKYLFYSLIVLIFVLPLGWFTLKDYQKTRITSFLNPQLDQRGINYNMTQAVITVGSGQFFGRGLGYGTQSKLFFLPENHTDFAFSSLIEQFGFVGGISVLILYFIIIVHLVRKLSVYFRASDEDNRFNFFYVLGFFSYFIFQVFVNIGMNLGLLPITGIALPLISYGGSSLVSFMLGLALIP